VSLVAEHQPGRVEGEGGQVVVRISDTGVGIAPEKIPQLFEMFVQIDGTRGGHEGGLGIGLALVRHLVEMHGGSVAASSEGLGRGAEFVVRLPVAATTRVAAGPADAVQRAASPPRRILVADDLPDNATSLTVLLRRLGHEVETAYGGVEAIQAAERFRPELALLDIGMPDVDGFEVCRRLRAEPWGKDMVLVALTGWGQERDRRKALEAGFDAHLVKPLDPARLETLLSGFGPGGSGGEIRPT
jgi:CheY-like chemotaxis protein